VADVVGGLRVVRGSPVAIEDALIAHVARIRAREPLAPVDVLVGGVLMAPYLKRRLATGDCGLINVRLATLGEFGIRLGGVRLRQAGRASLPAVAERALVTAAARECGGYFAPVAGMPGFADAARRLVRELREEGRAPDELRAAVGIESPEKAADLADLYARYLAGRTEWFDGLDGIAAADAADFDGIELILFGIWRLGEVARRLVARIADRVPVSVYLPSVDPDADDAHRALGAWLEELGAAVDRLPAPVRAATPLRRLRDGLYRPADPIDLDETVRLVSAPDPPSEVRAVARQCVAWARDGIPFREMAIVYRQAETYRPLVESVFDEAGIPVYLDDGPSIAHRPVGRRVLAYVDLLESRLPRRDVMAFLSDGELPAGCGDVDVLLWDAVSRHAGVVEGPGQWRDRVLRIRADKPWNASGRRWTAEQWDTGCVALVGFIDRLAGVIAARPSELTWQTGIDFICDGLARYVSGVEPVIAHLADLADLDAISRPGGFGEVCDAIRTHVRAMPATDVVDGRSGAFGVRGVSVLDANQMRHLTFRAVAVVGLTERSFPPPPRQDPLLLDDERRALNTRYGWTIPLRARGDDIESLQFALVVHGARERLLVSSARSDHAGGRARLPSVFFGAAAGAVAGTRLSVAEVDLAPCVTRLPAGRLGAADLGAALTVGEWDRTLLEENPGLGGAVLRARNVRADRAAAVRDARWSSTALTPFDGAFRDPEARAAATRRAGQVMAVTAIEQYATCPMRHFLGHILRLDRLDEPAEILHIHPLDRGSAVHEILERFVPRFAGRPGAADHNRLRAALDAVASEVLGRYEAAGRTGAPLLWDLDRDVIMDDLHGWLAAEIADPAALDTRLLEVPFGGGRGPAPPSGGTSGALEVPAGNRTLRLRGRIDRLEYDGGRFRIIDYKTGRGPKTGDGELDGGRALQLPVYLLAGAQLLGRDATTGDAEYHVVSRQGRFGRIRFDGRQLAERATEFDAALGRIADGIADGDFHAEPGPDVCRYCTFDGLCDAGRVALHERKQGDARMQSFARMREIP
jgi:ATP-dependent helicase/nuclease subunit B